jgi:hypothetical protein
VSASTCPGCGLVRPASDLVYDRKFNASAECWALFEQAIAEEFQNPAIFGPAHQITVDAYAVQHAGGRHPDKSVCIHLVGLYWTIERALAPTDVPPRLQRLAGRATSWPHFEVPAARASLTVHDVVLASGAPEAHVRAVRAWGRAVWDVWEVHHEAVRRLAEPAGGASVL